MTSASASSSNSDDDSSSSSRSMEEIMNQGKTPLHDESDDEKIDAQLSNFDDLPTDDSEDEDESDSDNSGDSSSINEKRGVVDSSASEGRSSYNDVNQEDVPLSERVASRAHVGRRYYTGEDNAANQDGTALGEGYDDQGKRRRAERKSRAIELASERLREARWKEKGVKTKHNNNNSMSEDSSVEQQVSSNNKTDDGETATKRKKSKHKPTEMSSKRRDYFARGRPDLNSSGIGVSIGANRYKARDPRMVSLSGHLDADVFEKRYGFLDEIQEKEIEKLKRRVNAWKKSGKKGQKERRRLGMTQGGGSLEDDQEELTRLLQERAERKKANVVRAAKRSVKQKIRDDVASGKRGAYYPKRSELKRMEAEAKYEEIRKRGGDEAVDKAIAKRRKKNVSKASKQMPSHMVLKDG